MNMSRWVALMGGRRAVARLLNVTPNTVYYWMRGDVTPRSEKMEEIERVSQGKVTIREMVRAKSVCKTRKAVLS